MTIHLGAGIRVYRLPSVSGSNASGVVGEDVNDKSVDSVGAENALTKVCDGMRLIYFDEVCEI